MVRHQQSLVLHGHFELKHLEIVEQLLEYFFHKKYETD